MTSGFKFKVFFFAVVSLLLFFAFYIRSNTLDSSEKISASEERLKVMQKQLDELAMSEGKVIVSSNKSNANKISLHHNIQFDEERKEVVQRYRHLVEANGWVPYSTNSGFRSYCRDGIMLQIVDDRSAIKDITYLSATIIYDGFTIANCRRGHPASGAKIRISAGPAYLLMDHENQPA